MNDLCRSDVACELVEFWSPSTNGRVDQFLSINFFVNFLYFVCDVIATIYNKSFALGRYPSKLKMAKVIPIFKADDDTDPNNYRPISLLSSFNQIFERLLYNRMKEFIDKNNILCTSQYGFTQGHSTEHAILDIVNAIQSNMDKGAFSCWVFIDLKKAFDTVDHRILLHKL